MAQKLASQLIVKPWGRTDLSPWAENTTDELIGEVRFDSSPAAELSVKFIFASQPLSIQVHPKVVKGRTCASTGKDEAWYILDADQDASIILGPRENTSRQALLESLANNALEETLHQHRPQKGETIYVPAGTIHSIGAGITLLEVQQNVDVTYRLFDYGRPRDLQIESALDCANLQPFSYAKPKRHLDNRREVLREGGSFVIEKWRMSDRTRIKCSEGVTLWFVPISGRGAFANLEWKPGEVWTLCEGDLIEPAGECEMIAAYSGADVIEGLLGAYDGAAPVNRFGQHTQSRRSFA